MKKCIELHEMERTKRMMEIKYENDESKKRNVQNGAADTASTPGKNGEKKENGEEKEE